MTLWRYVTTLGAIVAIVYVLLLAVTAWAWFVDVSSDWMLEYWFGIS